MSRIKLKEARKYLQLSQDSFKEWCAAVRLVAYKYEFSRRQYFIRGDFFAKADAELIERLKKMYGDKWGEFYDYFNDVKAFVKGDSIIKEVPKLTEECIPLNSHLNDFIKKLKK